MIIMILQLHVTNVKIVLFLVKKHQRGPGPQEVLYLHRRGGRGNLIDGLFMRGGRGNLNH